MNHVDTESSDLNFSEEHAKQDEHEYQIAELGTFDVEPSISDDIEALNKEHSVDFSDGQFTSDFEEKKLPAEKVQESMAISRDESSNETNDDFSYSYISEDSSNAN